VPQPPALRMGRPGRQPRVATRALPLSPVRVFDKITGPQRVRPARLRPAALCSKHGRWDVADHPRPEENAVSRGCKPSMFVHSVLYFLLRQSAHWRQPRLAAWLLLLTSRTLLRSGDEGKGTKHRALVLTRMGFSEDIEETFRGARDFDVVIWPSFALKAFAAAILSPSLDHNYYLTNDPKIEATKRAYRDFLAQVWKHFSKLMPIDVVLTGNFS